ncbi:hypothetical protein PIB30_021587 [Stylosanthes scabra]|uniref:Reverse transcriptase zinc-binding domain-containing protein n=1 Tax=Stylosanthes scabra TaxID=79078 RepID=A0ABU6U8S3_9FABA|nr:hypothetical protein [Stylosanthes scabra]
MQGKVEGRALSLINWSTVVTPKKYGGLGIRDTVCVNTALLGNPDQSFWYSHWLPCGTLASKLPFVHITIPISACLISREMPRYPWKGLGVEIELSHVYSTKDGYNWLAKLKHVPTASFRYRRGLASSDVCMCCAITTEMVAHCFLFCPKSIQFGYGLVFILLVLLPPLFVLIGFVPAASHMRSYFVLFFDEFGEIRIMMYFALLADFGCIIRDPTGLCLRGCSGSIRANSSLVCELFEIWHGLYLARESGFRNSVRIMLIQRSTNGVADFLAKTAVTS